MIRATSPISLARKHISFNINGTVTLILSTSKIDPFQTGVNIHLAASSSPLCLITALTLLFTSPLFVRSYDQPFTKQFFVLSIHHLLLWAGIPTTGFSGHSIRKGAAVIAACNGISRNDVKLLGRWTSDVMSINLPDLILLKN